MLWSIVPTDTVFLDASKESSPYRACTVSGVTMMISDAGQGMGKIERIFSSNPSHYMRKDWQPGSLVPLSDAVFFE